eukprot:8967839-Heterocapsa_arctica.AAC.1
MKATMARLAMKATIPLDKTKYSRMAMVYEGVNEKTTTDVLALAERRLRMRSRGLLLLPASDANDCVAKSMFNN